MERESLAAGHNSMQSVQALVLPLGGHNISAKDTGITERVEALLLSFPKDSVERRHLGACLNASLLLQHIRAECTDGVAYLSLVATRMTNICSASLFLPGTVCYM